jgi:hypothetical protein
VVTARQALDGPDGERYAAWAARLRHFRICLSYGGHADFGDDLQVGLAVDGCDDLQAVVGELGVALERVPEGAPRAQPGRAHTLEEWTAIPPRVRGCEWWRQPGRCRIAGVDVHLSGSAEAVNLSISHGYVISDELVDRACRVEAVLEALCERVADPPVAEGWLIRPARA